jgi:hypothetical protein
MFSDQPDALAFITIKENGRVNDIFQKDGEKVKFTQSSRGKKGELGSWNRKLDMRFTSLLPLQPLLINFACIASVLPIFNQIGMGQNRQRIHPAHVVVWYGRQRDQRHSATKEASRSLFEDGHDDNHDHFDHNHSDHDHSDHDHTHHFVPSKTKGVFADLQGSLRGRGLELHIGKRRCVQGASYGYWVDVYIEIDYALCTKHGET